MSIELPDFFHTTVCDMFDIEYPIIQAGMGGTRNSMADLTAAVADAGGLGQIIHPGSGEDLEEGLPSSEEEFISRIVDRQQEVIDEVLKKTDGPFIINCRVNKLQIDAPHLIEALIERAKEDEEFSRQCKGILTSAGAPSYADKIHEAGLLNLHTCALPYHAKKAADMNVDVVNVTGYEAGGHISKYPVNTFPLVAAVAKMGLDVPITAGGGIFHGSQITALMMLGVQAAYIGTRLLVSDECDYHENSKKALASPDAGIEDTIVGPSVLADARFYRTKAAEKLKQMAEEGRPFEEIVSEEVKGLRNMDEGGVENAAIFAGQAIEGIREVKPVKQIIEDLVLEAREAFEAHG